MARCPLSFRCAALALPLALLAACSSYVDRRAEDVIREALPRLVGPAERYDVKVSGATLAAGRFARVQVSARRLQRAGQPVVDQAEIDLVDVDLDRVARRLTRVGSAHMRAQILSADLAAFLMQRNWVDNASVSFLPPDVIVVGGVPRVAGVALPRAAATDFRGRLVARGSQLRLAVDSLQVGNVRPPAFALLAVEGAINPLFDVARYPVPARFDAVAVQGDALIVTASGVNDAALAVLP